MTTGLGLPALYTYSCIYVDIYIDYYKLISRDSHYWVTVEFQSTNMGVSQNQGAKNRYIGFLPK